MISTSQISLRDARADCGISASGGLRNVTEFVDRHGSSGYSLRDLAGHVIAKSSKTVTGRFRSNTNPGSGARPNYAEANVYSINQGHQIDLSKNGADHYAEGFSIGDPVLGGYAYVGTIPPGTRNYKVYYQYSLPGTGFSGSVELIGWPSGYFVGTPEYYLSWVSSSDAYGGEASYSLDGSATPYLTLNLQLYTSDYNGKINITRLYVKA